MPTAVKKEPPSSTSPTSSSVGSTSSRPATRNAGLKRSSVTSGQISTPSESPNRSMDTLGNTIDAKKPNIPGFLTKTFEIFSNEEYSDLCGWGENGDTIVIKKVAEFSATVLPKYFKHSNFQSFVRQLNMYDFHKTVQDPSHGEFKHEYFKKGRADLLRFIKRKVSQPAVSSTKGSNEPIATTTAITATSGVGSSSVASTGPATGASSGHSGQAAVSLTGSAVGATEPQIGSKTWQRKQEQRLNSLEDANRILMQENQVLFHTVNQQGVQIRLLREHLTKLVGVMNDYTEGNVPAIRIMKQDLEHHTMPAPLSLVSTGGALPAHSATLHTDTPLASLPLLALPATMNPTTTDATSHVTTVPTTTTTTPAAPGGDLARTTSLEQFWRGQSLTSLPSFGPDLVDLPPDFLFSRMGSLERLHSLDRTSSVERAKKRGRLAHNPEAVALHDQLEMLKKNQQEGFQRIDSLEQQLTTLFEDGDLVDLDNEAAVPHAVASGSAQDESMDVHTDSEPATPPETSFSPPYHLPDMTTAPTATTPTYSPLSPPTTATTTQPSLPLPAFPPSSVITGPQVSAHHMEGGALVKQQAFLGMPPHVTPPVEAGMVSRRML